MLNVFFTVDVEIWCGGWRDLDARFPEAFRKYIYGTTSTGDYGLPFQMKVLNDHGLTGVFFTEALFATRFGLAPLQEIVGLVHEGGQEVQLHLHTEWVDEALTPLLPAIAGVGKRQHMRCFSVQEQTTLIERGLTLLRAAGAPAINAFRAGSFACNRDTLSAVAANRIPIDSSYNASMFGPDSGILPGKMLTDQLEVDGVLEYPMTVFTGGTGSLRHAQLTSCSWPEMEGLLWRALEQGQQSFVILSHSFELLNPARTRADDIVVQRFRKLCAFLEKHRDKFNVQGFDSVPVGTPRIERRMQPRPLTSPLYRTGLRVREQMSRRRFA